MTPAQAAFEAATDALYRAFEHYPLRPDMPRCPCCVTPAAMTDLTSRPLGELDDELNLFTSNALTTWGDVEDLKHFLPRLLERAARDERRCVDSVLLGDRLSKMAPVTQ